MCCHGRRTMKKTIRYESDNGYYGVMEGKEVTIRDSEGRLRFHTFVTAFQTEKDLRQFVDEFPEFLEMMNGVTDDGVQ